MKTTFYLLMMLSCLSFLPALGQAKYDDFPTTVPRNADVGKKKSNKDGPSTNFVPIGTSWGRRVLSYAFENGTDDIAGDNERQAIRDAFALWAAQTDLAFVETCNPSEADISFKWASGYHGDPNCPGGGAFDGRYTVINGQYVGGAILAHNLGGPAPNSCDGQAADIHFDEDEDWTLDLRGDGNQAIDLVSIAAHEIGHALGLFHTSVQGSLMWATYGGSHRFLGSDDIAGIQSIYGPRQNGIIRSPNIDLNTQPICGGVILVVDAPVGTSVSWSSSDPNALSVGSNGYASRQNNFNGQVTVTAVVSTNCSSVTLTKVVSVGAGRTGGTYSYGGNTYNVTGNTGISVSNSSNTIYFNLNNSTDPNASYSWSVTNTNGNVYHSLSTGKTGSITLGGGASATVTCTIATPCGQTSITFSCYNYSGSWLVAYPNPTSDLMTVTAFKESGGPSEERSSSNRSDVGINATPTAAETTVKLLDKNNNVLREGKLVNGEVQFSLAQLPNGIYYLQMNTDERRIKRQIVVQH
ncbi:matrixin [Spirosoma oryzae]|uniref:Matrixin n=2 Tax=Spirosoma oryzae TaxID=1469603 RepID=A0A2T0SRD1_9BACT|nr:matrixin [Spirosoma oryzae]